MGDDERTVIAGRVPADVAKRAKIRAVERGEQLQDLLLRALLRELEEPLPEQSARTTA